MLKKCLVQYFKCGRFIYNSIENIYKNILMSTVLGIVLIVQKYKKHKNILSLIQI